MESVSWPSRDSHPYPTHGSIFLVTLQNLKYTSKAPRNTSLGINSALSGEGGPGAASPVGYAMTHCGQRFHGMHLRVPLGNCAPDPGGWNPSPGSAPSLQVHGEVFPGPSLCTMGIILASQAMFGANILFPSTFYRI